MCGNWIIYTDDSEYFCKRKTHVESIVFYFQLTQNQHKIERKDTYFSDAKLTLIPDLVHLSETFLRHTKS